MPKSIKEEQVHPNPNINMQILLNSHKNLIDNTSYLVIISFTPTTSVFDHVWITKIVLEPYSTMYELCDRKYQPLKSQPFKLKLVLLHMVVQSLKLKNWTHKVKPMMTFNLI